MKVVLAMCLVSLVVPSFYAYFRWFNWSTGECDNRVETPAMAIYKAVLESLFCFIAPFSTLIVNGLVIHGVRQARIAGEKMHRRTPMSKESTNNTEKNG